MSEPLTRIASVVQWLRAGDMTGEAKNLESAMGALLEEHRNEVAALTLARDMALAMHEAAQKSRLAEQAEHRKALEAERAKLSVVLGKVREALAVHGEGCPEGGLVGVLNGIERVAVRARNEGLEKAAAVVDRWDLAAKHHIQHAIRAMKEPE